MKLKTMLAVVAGALGLCATAVELPDGVSFEQTAGVVQPGGITEAKGATWAAADAENTTLEVKEYGTETKYVYENPDNARNAMFDAQDNYLSVKTKIGSPLNRSAEVEMGTGVYFDSLVKFTACDEAPAADSYSDAKLVAYVLEDETNGKTNFFVRAVGGDYNLGAVADIDSWHRLTIKVIPGIYKEDRPVPGFAIYLDGNPVTVTDTDYATKSTITAENLTNNAKVLFNAKNLFVSLNGTGGNYQKITSVGFDGHGAIDDLAFTTTAPVTAAADLLFATVKIGEKIASFTVDGVTYTEDADAQIINGKVAVSDIVYRSGYFGPTSAELDAASGAELALDDQAKDIVATIDDAPYESIGAAIEEAGDDAVIVLEAEEITATAAILVDKPVTIDLNGCTVTGAAGVSVFAIGDAVTFIDSIGSGAVKATQAEEAEAAYAVILIDEPTGIPALTIEGGTFAGAPENADFNLGWDLTPVITGGWFLNDPSTYLEGTDYEAVQDETHDSYFKVQEKQVEMGTVIILVDGAEKKTLEPQEVGTTVDLTAVEGLKETWQKLTWADVDDPTTYEVVKGEQRLNATTDINLTLDNGSYLIGEAADLKTLADAVAGGYDTADKTFKQTKDIVWTEQDGDFLGIGKYVVKAAGDYAFKGTYDGQNHTIENIVFGSNGENKYLGVFAQVAGGTIKNLKVKNASTSITTGEFGGAMAVGHLFGGRVENVTSEGAFGSTDKPMTGTAAGIVCRAQFGEVVNCTNTAALYGSGEKIAGIIGITQNGTEGQSVKITDCANSGNMYSTHASGSIHIGGIIGYAQHAPVTLVGCSNSGTTTATITGNIGELVGLCYSGEAITGTGCSGTANRPAVGNVSGTTTGLAYGVNDGAKVTYTDALAKDTTFILEKGSLTPTFVLQAAGDFIAFDATLKTGTYDGITAKGDLTIETTNVTDKVTKFTAKAAAQEDDPTVIDPADIPAGKTVSEIFKAVPADLANADASKFATWCQGKATEGGASVGTAGADAKLDAFLLNCANDETAVEAAKEAFKIPEITVDADGTVTVKSPDGTYNGTVTIKGSATVDGKYELEADNAEAKFFKAILSL